MKIGIVSNYYLTGYGYREGAERMRKHGYLCADYQDFVNTETDFFKLCERDFEKTLREQRNTVEGCGITFSQTHSPWRYPPRDFLPEDRAERLESMKKAIRGTAYLGAPYFVVHPVMPFGANSSDNAGEMIEMNCDFMGQLADAGREYGVTVCLENLPTWYTDGKGFRMIYEGHCCNPYDAVAEIDMLNDIAGKECFGLCLDTGHLNITRTPVNNYVSVLGNRIKCLHMHDNNGMDDSHMAPYTGSVRWEDYISALRAIGYSGDLSFETFRQTTKSVMPAELVSPWLRLMAQEADYFRREITK